MYYVYEINGKIFHLADVLFWGVILYFDKYIFPWQKFFFWGGGGGGLSLHIRVILHSAKYSR